MFRCSHAIFLFRRQKHASCEPRINGSLLPFRRTGGVFLFSPAFLGDPNVIPCQSPTLPSDGQPPAAGQLQVVGSQPLGYRAVPTAQTPPPQEHTTTHVAVCLLQFWNFSLSILLLQTEAQFELACITTQTTQHQDTVTALPPDGTIEVPGVLSSTPANNHYGH